MILSNTLIGCFHSCMCSCVTCRHADRASRVLVFRVVLCCVSEREVLVQVLVSKSNVLRPAVFDAYRKDVELMVFLFPRCILKVVLLFVHYLGSCRLLNLSVRVVMTAKCFVT